MGVFFVKKVENGVFYCKKVDLSSTQGALCTVSVFFILHFTYLGGVRMHPPANGPGKPIGERLHRTSTHARTGRRTCWKHNASVGPPQDWHIALLAEKHTYSSCFRWGAEQINISLSTLEPKWGYQRRRNVLKSDTAHIVFLVDTAS